jgi:hypothetical protein
MNFGQAQEAIENGERVARAGWNGKGMWLSRVSENWSGSLRCRENLPPNFAGYLPFYVMYTADGKLVPWLASQTDLAATDWVVLVDGTVAHEAVSS